MIFLYIDKEKQQYCLYWRTAFHDQVDTHIHPLSTITHFIFIGYWLDMEIYVRVLVRSNIARRQERNINYAPERVHTFPYPTNNRFITYALAALL